MLRGNNSLKRIMTEYIELSVYTDFPGIGRLDVRDYLRLQKQAFQISKSFVCKSNLNEFSM